MQPTPCTVSTLTQQLKGIIEGSFSQVCVQGEVSNFKLQSSGHLYFTLKDPQAQIQAVMFRSDASQLNFLPKDGDLVVAEGGLNVYAAGGRYQITIQRMQRQGLGELLLLLEQRKQAIAKRGWFRPEHKKPLPFLPKRIGVVTSPTGAAVRDIIEVISRRAGGFHLILNPVKVQGEGAAEEIAEAIAFFNDHLPVDLLIVGRGGGSFEDLWCFNEECVAAAIFESKIPIICAVGHETDHCIAEYVADKRAPTPSAAAEMAVAEHVLQRKRLVEYTLNVERCIRQRITHSKQLLQRVALHPILLRPKVLLEGRMQRLDDLIDATEHAIKRRLYASVQLFESYRRLVAAHNPLEQLHKRKQRLQQYIEDFKRALEQQLEKRRLALASIQNMLKAIDINHLLKRGFCLLFAEKDGSIIKDASSVARGDSVHVRLSGGSLKARVEEVIGCE